VRPLVVEGELSFVEVRGSRAADRAAEAWDVHWRYIKGEASELEVDRFSGLRIGGRQVETDHLVLERLAHAGELDVAEIYQELVA